MLFKSFKNRVAGVEDEGISNAAGVAFAVVILGALIGFIALWMDMGKIVVDNTSTILEEQQNSVEQNN